MRSADLSDAELLYLESIEAAEAGDQARARDLLRLALSLEGGNEPARQELARLGEQDQRQERELLPAQGPPQGQAVPQEQDPPRQDGPLHGLREAVGAGAILDSAPAGERPIETSVEPARRARSGPLSGLLFILRSEFALIAGLGLVLLALIALANLAGVEGLPAPLPLLRLLLGLAFVLFVPGYALQAALFPRRDALDGPERLALSFGLSVALVPILALILDWLPWGIRLWPIVIAEALVIAILSALALVRRRRLPAEARPVLAANVDLKGWWAAQDRTGRVLYGVLGGALLLALVSAAAIILVPKPGEQFTEFYLLGSQGLAESYPREAAPGETLSVTAGIANREGTAAEYRVEVQVDGEPIGAAGPVTLGDGEVWEAPVTYALPRAGEDQQIDFLLFRDGEQEPYRSLRMWINIVEAPRGGDD